MAPISVAKEAVVQPTPNQVCSTATHFKEHFFKSKQISRIMRCSSVTSEEQESCLLDKTEFRRWLVSSSICEKSREVAFCDSGTSTSHQDWTEVTPALEEDERPAKVISMVLLEPEEKKLAVENDDESSAAAEESISFEYTFEKKYTLKAFQIESKSEKRAEVKRKESLKKDALLLVPYSIEETEHSNTEDQKEQIQPQVEVSLPLCDGSDLEPEDDLSSSKVDCAEVQIEELKLVVKEMEDKKHKDKVTKQRSTFRRHAVRKMKRSIWCITDPEPPPVQQKRKKTCREVNRTKQRCQRRHANESFPAVEKSATVKEQPRTKGKKRKTPTSPVREEPRDSGVHSNSSGDGGSSSSSGSSSGNFSSGNFRGEGSGTHGNGGAGGSGDDGEKGRKPWRHLPGGGGNAMLERDKKEDEEKEDQGQEKMDVDTLVTDFGMFLPSKVDNTEQCHSPGLGQPVTMDTELFFSPQDLQHASYCSTSPCHNGKCKQVKSAVEHFKTHKDWIQCSHCMNTHNVIKQHAQFCSRPGCRVPNCDDIRKKKKAGHTNIGKPVPPVVQRVPVQVPYPEAWIRPTTLGCTPLWGKNRSDGKVIFRNSPFIPPDYFSEHFNYNVVRKEKMGGGSNGNIYRVYLQSDRSKKIVVKETNYPIRLEEVEVYKLLGDHENIVKHYGGTFRGSEGRASIFMEECEMSLFHYMDEVLKRRLSVGEAMFFWPQVVKGVSYLHSLPTPVIHKDIKAKNILLTEEYTRAKLADYDSARRLRDEFTEAGLRPLGTKGFAAPEVLESRPHGRPADVHSLGCSLIEMIVGVPTQDTLQEKIHQLGELDPDLARLVQACVRESPDQRPTARSLLESQVVRKYARS